MKRTKIPIDIATEVLFSNDHTCCICQTPGKHVQLHHINGDPKDHSSANLAVLCLDHHSRISGDEGFGRQFTADEVRRYKVSWEALVRTTRPQNALVTHQVLEFLHDRPEYCDHSRVEKRRCETCSPLHRIILDYLLADQIASSGGWGESQAISYRHVTETEPSPLEKVEGGIISTFLVLRSMESIHPDINEFRRSDTSRKALRYLIERQSPSGGFGRRVRSRSGIEIHTSVRHTALAISCFQLLDAAPRAVFEGLKFLSRRSVADFESDACPSIAASAMIGAMEKLSRSGWAASNLTLDEATEGGLKAWPELKTQLIRLLLDSSTTNPYSPLWPPYGGYKKQLLYTSLITLDLLFDETHALSPSLVESILREILKHEIDGGLPYDPITRSPDVGMSGLFASVVSRLAAAGALPQNAAGEQLYNAAIRFYKFSFENINSQAFMAATYCDTLAPILLLHGCPWRYMMRNGRADKGQVI